MQPTTAGQIPPLVRSGRLIVADFFHVEQHTIKRRLFISIPIFVITAAILIWSIGDKEGFNILWRYFAWSNQTLSVFTLWAITMYLMKNRKLYWITYIPAIFMTAVCSSYILVAPEGLALDYTIGIACGCLLSMVIGAGVMIHYLKQIRPAQVDLQSNTEK